MSDLSEADRGPLTREARAAIAPAEQRRRRSAPVEAAALQARAGFLRAGAALVRAAAAVVPAISSSRATPPTTSRRRFRLRGALDVAALERAFDAIVARHEALRTTFVERDGQPVQVVEPSPHAEAGACVDLRGCRAGSARRRCGAWRRRRRGGRSTWRAGPLLRVRLLRLGDAGARAAADDAPHRLRRLVAGRADPRAGGAVPGASPAAGAPAAAAAADAVRGLRAVAARAGSQGEVLEAQLATGSSSWPARPRCWSCPRIARARRCRPPARRQAGGARCRGADGGAQGAGPARGRHALHDPAGGVPGAAAPLHRAGGRRAWARPSPAGTARSWRG